MCAITGGELSKEFFDEYEKQYADVAQWVDFSKLDTLTMYSSIDIMPIIKKAQRMVM